MKGKVMRIYLASTCIGFASLSVPLLAKTETKPQVVMDKLAQTEGEAKKDGDQTKATPQSSEVQEGKADSQLSESKVSAKEKPQSLGDKKEDGKAAAKPQVTEKTQAPKASVSKTPPKPKESEKSETVRVVKDKKNESGKNAKSLNLKESSRPEAGKMMGSSSTPVSIVGEKAPEKPKKGAAAVPPAEQLVNIEFPEMTDIADIAKAVATWTGKNVILDRNVTGKVQILSPRKVTKEEAYQAFLSALSVLDLTTVETGAVTKIMKSRNAIRDNLQTYMGSSWAPKTDAIITQMVPLKYIDAKQLKTTLASIASPNSIIAYEPTNTLIVSDSGYKVQRYLDIISLLDVQTEQPQVVLVPIKYSDAKSVSDKVNQILKAASQSVGGKTGMRNFNVLVDDRTNSVIIFGPPRTISDVKELVRKFDVAADDPSAQATIHVRALDYADAKKLAATLSSLASSNKNKNSRRPPMSNPSKSQDVTSVSELGDDVKITSDEATNALIITGSKANYNALNSIIRKLDIRRAQVYIEADILDLNSGNNFFAGTSIFAGFGSSKEGKGAKTIVGWETEKGGIGPLVTAIATANNSSSSTTNTNAIAQAAGAFSKNLSVGVLAGEFNVPGIGTVTPGALINLMKEDSNSRNLSSPNILTSNNEEANIVVGQKRLFKTAVTTPQGTTNQQIQKEDIDTSLTVKPNISYSNYVTLNFQIEANQLADLVDGIPQIAKRKTKQIVTVKNHQTVVISGLMQEQQVETYAKIPLLGDIPVLGWLFRNSSIEKNKTNLVIFLTPHIVHGAADLADIYRKKMEERDDYFKQVFGRGYAKSDFYKQLPKREDGAYKPTPEDKKEDIRQEKTKEDLKKMMDYDFEAKSGMNSVGKSTKEETLTVPVPMGGSGSSGSSIERVAPAGEDIPPPPPLDEILLEEDVPPPGDF